MKNEITRVKEMPPNIIRVAKTHEIFVDWREDVVNGAPHPVLQAEDYVRINIGNMHVDTSFNHMNGNGHGYRSDPLTHLEEYEQEALKTFLKNPAVAWAVDNSFDGVYVIQDNYSSDFTIQFVFSVYLKREHATFWTLKYSGT